MNHDTATVHEYFAKLGLDPEVANIYLALQEHGPQSLLQLSRNAKVERTRIYRLLDSLKEHYLIEEEELYKRKLYKAAPLTNLQILLSKREQQLLDLQAEMLRLHESAPTAESSVKTHVQFYQGEDGFRQMLWNQTNSTSENLTLLYENMQSKTNAAFFKRWVEKCNSKGLTSRSIVGNHFLSTQQAWYSQHQNERLKNWQGRQISDDVFAIRHSTVIYNDVVAYYDWKKNDIYGIEIYNQHIADGQRQIFELLWKLSKEYDDSALTA
ncbi:MAG TPA: helix-turn-helix domain-containing protein [Verrucomicrobiae bacterium]|nr:helix-turn-helix domain-containing protein [Verrucomicrobiae bacterium]